ncbi:MAG TPA: CheR family methyltransferase [bacterium]|nr:CheR family methyltransferase [bacterium]
MKVADFELYKSLLYSKSGLVITPDKSYLLDSRLTPIAKKWNYPTLEIMTLQLRALPDPKLVKDIVEAMTTNETSFFRDTKPFTLFQETILPHMIQNRAAKKSIRIWCAACSSGQEPYSLCMILKDKEALLKGWRIHRAGRIRACRRSTHISQKICRTPRRLSCHAISSARYRRFHVERKRAAAVSGLPELVSAAEHKFFLFDTNHAACPVRTALQNNPGKLRPDHRRGAVLLRSGLCRQRTGPHEGCRN